MVGGIIRKDNQRGEENLVQDNGKNTPRVRVS